MQTQTFTQPKPKTGSKREVAVVIFGRDSKKKAHAASFEATDTVLAL